MRVIDAKIDEYLKELESNDKAEGGADGGKIAAEITEIVKGLTARKERYQKFAKELAETGETQKSLTDADSRLMKTKDGVEVCYNVQTAVDSKHKLVRGDQPGQRLQPTATYGDEGRRRRLRQRPRHSGQRPDLRLTPGRLPRGRINQSPR